jgi:hypothetical protein
VATIAQQRQRLGQIYHVLFLEGQIIFKIRQETFRMKLGNSARAITFAVNELDGAKCRAISSWRSLFTTSMGDTTPPTESSM